MRKRETRGSYGEIEGLYEPQRVRGVTDEAFLAVLRPYRFALHQELALYKGLRGRLTPWDEAVFLRALEDCIRQRWTVAMVWPYYEFLIERRAVARRPQEDAPRAAA